MAYWTEISQILYTRIFLTQCSQILVIFDTAAVIIMITNVNFERPRDKVSQNHYNLIVKMAFNYTGKTFCIFIIPLHSAKYGFSNETFLGWKVISHVDIVAIRVSNSVYSDKSLQNYYYFFFFTFTSGQI
jgi:hypothetical protein